MISWNEKEWRRLVTACSKRFLYPRAQHLLLCACRLQYGIGRSKILIYQVFHNTDKIVIRLHPPTSIEPAFFEIKIYIKIKKKKMHTNQARMERYRVPKNQYKKLYVIEIRS